MTNPYDSTNHIAYVSGDGYTAGHSYRVGFYDAASGAGGDKVASVNATLTGAALTAQLDLSTDTSRVRGTWSAVAFDTRRGRSCACPGQPQGLPLQLRRIFVIMTASDSSSSI